MRRCSRPQTLVRGAFTVLAVAASIGLPALGRSGIGFLTATQGAGALVGAVFAFGLVGGRSLALTFTVCLALWGLADRAHREQHPPQPSPLGRWG